MKKTKVLVVSACLTIILTSRGTNLFSYNNVLAQDRTRQQVTSVNFDSRQNRRGYETIESDVMKIKLDSTFPRVEQYEWKSDKKILKGEIEKLNKVTINGKEYTPKVTFKKVNDSLVTYKLSVDEIKVDIYVEFKVDKNILNMKVTNIVESGNVKVYKFNILNEGFISVDDNLGKVSAASVLNSNQITEFKNKGVSQINANTNATYAIINNNEFAASINNNVIDSNRLKVTQKTIDGVKYASISNGDWEYRTLDNKKTELPNFKVVITRDENKDGIIDWQDGAIGYRKIMTVPYKSEQIKNNMSYISMNIGLTQNPFLRVFDNAKKLYNTTDGFGQMILLKGYQAEGHDDSHPDYGGHIGIRQGGVKDMNTLIEKGKEYNLNIGVHINETEAHRDSFEMKRENFQYNNHGGLNLHWRWLDSMYNIDQEKDIASGELDRRLDMLKKDAPNLNWVYVDAYYNTDWKAYKMYKALNDREWMAATEFNGAMEQGTAWNHNGIDPAYWSTGRGNRSEIMRFINNQYEDKFMPDSLLKGNWLPRYGGWGNKVSLKEAYRDFYNQILVTKYMQHFPLLKWTSNEAKFEGGVISKKENGKVNIYKDGKLISTTDGVGVPINSLSNPVDSKVFIPWDPIKETKIYHWNPKGGTSTWDLPNSWAGQTSVKLYKLLDTGKKFVENIPVTSGKVTIKAEKDTPYLVVKGNENVDTNKDMNWGEGGLVKDPGFDSNTFTNWIKSSTNKNTDHIKFKEETVDRREGNDYLEIKGNNGADGIVTQKITGLTGGKRYSASVWVKANHRKAIIGVKDYGRKEVTNWVDRIGLNTYGEAVKHFKDGYTRMKVDFDVPQGRDSATLYLKGDKGNSDSSVEFDDVRIWQNPTTIPKPIGAIVYEDFENVDEGLGVFKFRQNNSTNVRTHLAQKGGTQIKSWVINGEYSLKTNQEQKESGEIISTDQSTLKLQPNKKYTVGFKYKYYDKSENNGSQNATYKLVIKSRTGKVISEEALDSTKEQYEKEFTTDNLDDYYIALTKTAGDNTLVIDDFYVKE